MQRHPAAQYCRRAYWYSVAVSVTNVLSEAQMKMQEWRDVISGRQKEKTATRQNWNYASKNEVNRKVLQKMAMLSNKKC
jgi:tRNA threonylcarbamoyladenosine modification (KEOPS) complex Cgi121 subunit